MSFDLIPFLKPIEGLLLQETVSEIMVNSDASIWVEENGRKQLLSHLRFEPGAFDAALEVMANRFGKKLDADSQYSHACLSGDRYQHSTGPACAPFAN